ncbi:MAG: hypothetical protein BGP01_02005 [Paludibacter sp. 47-17]|nr:MAG: hypothetical protein BGP01_02005 [Paludibacter sp. 47-17]
MQLQFKGLLNYSMSLIVVRFPIIRVQQTELQSPIGYIMKLRYKNRALWKIRRSAVIFSIQFSTQTFASQIIFIYLTFVD